MAEVMRSRWVRPLGLMALAAVSACGDGAVVPGGDAGAADAGVTVRVHADRPAGELPSGVYSAGIWVSMPFDDAAHPYGYLRDEYLAENRPGAVQFSRFMLHLIRDSRCYAGCDGSFEERLADAQSAYVVQWMLDVQARGGDVVLSMSACPTPEWLSACEPELRAEGLPVERCAELNMNTNADQCPLYSRYVPSDLDQWSQMIQEAAAHLRAAGVRASYITYHEPEPEWGLRTEQDYFEFHRATVVGIKRADPTASIGTFGATGGIMQIKHDSVTGEPLSDRPMMYDFIRYCSSTPLPEVGLSRIPIDFVNWHTFHLAPTTGAWRSTMDQGQAWLAEFGYPTDLPFYPGDWNLWDNMPAYPPGTPTQDNEVAASYIIASLVAMDRAGIARQSLDFDVDVWSFAAGGSQYDGRWPLFTPGFVKKASYNALRMVSAFQATERIESDAADPFIATVAGRDDAGRVFTMATNFVPYTPRMIQQWMQEFVRVRGYTVDDLRAAGVGPSEVRALAGGTTTPAALGLTDEALVTVLDDALDHLEEVHRRQTAPVDARFELTGLPAGTAHLVVYAIDATHANGFSVASEIDAAAADAATMADRAAADAVRARESELGYTPDDVTQLRALRDACHLDAHPRACALDWLTAHPGVFSHPNDQVVSDAMELAALRARTWSTRHAELIDLVNDRPEVDFTPIADRSVQITDGTYVLPARLAPYASVLIRLEP